VYSISNKLTIRAVIPILGVASTDKPRIIKGTTAVDSLAAVLLLFCASAIAAYRSLIILDTVGPFLKGVRFIKNPASTAKV
jgi:hypothetical protein